MEEPPGAVAPDSPAARRLGARRWRDPRLWVGVLLVAGSVLVGARVLAAADDTVGIWAARTDLPAGTALDPAALAVQQVRFPDAAAGDRYLPAAQPPPPGALLTRDVTAGELVPRGAVSTQPTSAVLEVPVVVGAAGAPDDLQTGETVDVWVVPDAAGEPQPPDAQLLLADVTVVSSATESGPLGEAATRQVLLGLDESARERLPEVLAGLMSGSVVLVRQQG